MKAGVVALLVALTTLIVGPARAGERLAVLISVEDDPELADNLTEVVIARLSSMAEYEFVGLRELESRLLELEPFARGGLPACVGDRSCLASIGAQARAKDAVVGRVRRNDERFSIDLLLIDTQTALRRAEISETSRLDVTELIATVQDAAARLFDARSKTPEPSSPAGLTQPQAMGAPVSPVPSPTSKPALAPPSTADAPVPREHSSSGRSQTRTVVAYGAAAAAVIAFSAATITGIIGRGTPQGATRAEAQADLERRKDYATASKGLLIGGAALTVVAGVTYFWP